MRPQATAAFNVGCASPFSQPRIRACLRWTTRADAKHLRAYQSPQLPEEAREAVRQMQIAYPLIDEPSNSKRALACSRQLRAQAGYFPYAELNEAAARRTRSRVAEWKVVALS